MVSVEFQNVYNFAEEVKKCRIELTEKISQLINCIEERRDHLLEKLKQIEKEYQQEEEQRLKDIAALQQYKKFNMELLQGNQLRNLANNHLKQIDKQIDDVKRRRQRSIILNWNESFIYQLTDLLSGVDVKLMDAEYENNEVVSVSDTPEPEMTTISSYVSDLIPVNKSSVDVEVREDANVDNNDDCVSYDPGLVIPAISSDMISINKSDVGIQLTETACKHNDVVNLSDEIEQESAITGEMSSDRVPDVLISSYSNIKAANSVVKLSIDYAKKNNPIKTVKLKHPYPTAIARDNDSNIYVASFTEGVHVYSSEGKYLYRCGKEGDIKYSSAYSMAICNNNLYIAGIPISSCNILLYYNIDGTFMKYIKGTDDKEKWFKLIGGVTCDSMSNVYMCDIDNNRIQVFTYDLCFKRIIGGRNCTLLRPLDAKVSNNNELVVLDCKEECYIHILTLEGSLVRAFKPVSNTCAEVVMYLTLDHDNNILLCDINLVNIFSNAGKHLHSIHFNNPEMGASQSRGLVFDSNNRIIVLRHSQRKKNQAGNTTSGYLDFF